MAHAVPSTAQPFRHAGTRHRASAGPPMRIFSLPQSGCSATPVARVNGTHARTHANKREKRRKKQQRFGYVHGMHSTTKSSSSVRHGLLQAGYLTDWLAAGRLGWAEVAQKEKNKRDSPIPQPRFCNTHPLHSRRHGAAQLPNPLCRRSLSQISEAFFKNVFSLSSFVCRRCRVTYLTLPYLAS